MLRLHGAKSFFVLQCEIHRLSPCDLSTQTASGLAVFSIVKTMTKYQNPKVGIYKIVLASILTNRILYIGQSKWIEERRLSHFRLLRMGKHHNPYLQNVYNKHSEQNIRFEVICECNISELDAMEQFYIDELKPECNIVRDVRSFWDCFRDEKNDLDTDVFGLEINWHPLRWHKWVYGSGRNSK